MKEGTEFVLDSVQTKFNVYNTVKLVFHTGFYLTSINNVKSVKIFQMLNFDRSKQASDFGFRISLIWSHQHQFRFLHNTQCL